MYQLSPSEIAQQVHLEFNGYIPNIFKTYSWATGFAWTYHVVLNINDVEEDIIDVEDHVVGPSKTCCPTVGLEDVGNVAIELQMHLMSWPT